MLARPRAPREHPPASLHLPEPQTAREETYSDPGAGGRSYPWRKASCGQQGAWQPPAKGAFLVKPWEGPFRSAAGTY